MYLYRNRRRRIEIVDLCTSVKPYPATFVPLLLVADQFVTEIRPRLAVSPRDARHDRLIRHFVPFSEVKRRLRDTLERNSKAEGFTR